MTENKGDIISREALKKTFENACIYGLPMNELYGAILKIIDNAPSVETYSEEDMCDTTSNGFDIGYDFAKAKYERPQGEWIANPLGDYVCNKCSWVVGKFERNFCPNCGAKMKGGAE